MNIKALRRILLLVLVISLVLITAVSCNDNDGNNTNDNVGNNTNDNDVESIFVNFIVDGKLYASLELTDSEDFQYPAEPTKEGYVFDNWYVDEDTYNILFLPRDASLYSKDRNIDVYAKWHVDESSCIHEWDDGTVLTEATETAPGLIRYSCSLCGASYTEKIPELPHTHTPVYVNAIDPTCQTSGVREHWYCEPCGNRYGDSACTVSLDVSSVTIAPTHTLEHYPKIAPSCYEIGLREHWYCATCDRYYDEYKNEISYEDIIILFSSHELSYYEKTFADCDTVGMEEHWFCVVCNKCFADKNGTNEIASSELITPMSHSLTLIPYTFPTCTENGYMQHWYCERCGNRFVGANGDQPTDISELIIPAAHSLTHYEKRPTECHVSGDIEYWYCSACGTYFGDADAQIQISPDDIISGDAVKLEYREYKDPTCEENGNLAYWYCPECGDMFQDVAGTLALTEADVIIIGLHELTQYGATPAGCYNDGNLDYWYCHKCEGYYLDAEATVRTSAENVVIPASHQTLHVDYSPSDCYNTGTLEHWKCVVCGAAFSDQEASIPFVGEAVIPASHTLTHTEAKPATCTEYGNYEYWYCEKCQYYFATESAISPVAASSLSYILPHTYEFIPYKEETCTSVGNISHYKCKECKKLFDYLLFTEITPDEVILTANHDMTYSSSTAPTCTASGEHEYWYCYKCDIKYADNDGATILESIYIAPLGHNYEDGICASCGERKPSEGLAFELSANGTSYTLVGRGTCTDNYLVIPAYYNGLPVTKIGPTAFFNDADIYSIALPETLIEISTGLADDAFFNHYNIVEIYNKSSINITTGSLANGTIALYAKNVYTPTSGESKLHETDEGFVFYVDGDEIYLTGYVGENQRIALPDSYDGRSYKIKDYTFVNSKVTGILIPEGVSYVGFRAFSSYHLVSITVASDNTVFNDTAFDSCVKLVEVFDLTSNPATKGSDDRGGIAKYALDVYTSLDATNKVVFDESGYIWYDHPNYCYLLGSLGYTDGTLVLPESYNGRGYEIYIYAFAERDDFTKITFPDTLSVIGASAFLNCSALTEVTIPLGVTVLNHSVFHSCTSLKTVNLHSGITDIKSTFYNCTSLQSIFIPKSVIRLGGFQYCSSLKEIEFEEGTQVTEFYDCAFFGTAITEFTFPSNVNCIGDSVFFGCENLVSVDFEDGNTLEYISYRCFGNCFALKEIRLPDSLYRIAFEAFIDAYALENVIFGNVSNALEINESAFSGCSSLGSVSYMGAIYIGTVENPYLILVRAESRSITTCTVHPSAKIIYSMAFYKCSMLESITMSDSLIEIQSDAFGYCTSLKSITIPESVVRITGHIVDYCSSLTEIRFNATKLEYSTGFRRAGGSEGLTLYIGKNVREIPAAMFEDMTYDATYLTNVVFEEGSVLEKIGNRAFYNCYNLQSINLPESLRDIGKEAFYGCSSITEFVIGKNITTLGYNAFAYCESLESVRLESDKIVSSGDSSQLYLLAGSGIENGISITIAKNVTAIPDYLFYTTIYDATTRISSIIFEDGSLCAYIGERAFLGCEGSIELTIPSKVSYIGAGAFASLNVTTLYFRAENMEAPVYENGICDWMWSEGLKLIIGNNVKSIPDKCFSDLIINTLTFEDGSVCTYIGAYAFFRARNLTSVILPESVTHVMEYAFSECSSLKEINFPKNVVYLNNPINNSPVEKIYYDAQEAEIATSYYGLFSGNKAGFEIVIGKNVISIPDGFLRNSTVTSVIFESGDTCTSVGKEAFRDCELLTEITLPESITHIDDSAFSNCTALTGITIPDATERIGKFAFYDSGITEVNISKSSALTEIGSYAFAYTGVTSITIPKGIISIGECAFEGLSLDYIYYDAKNYEHTNGNLFQYNQSGTSVIIGNHVEILYTYFGNVTSLEFEADSSCKIIGSSAFSYLEIETVTIPDSVVEILNGAFHNSQIKELIISKNSNLTYIGESAFNNCPLIAITIPEKVTYIGMDAFTGCQIEELYYDAVCVSDFLLTPLSSYNWIDVAEDGVDIAIGEHVEIIPQYFMYQKNIKSLTFEAESSCHTISILAFNSCSGAKAIALPESIKTIDHSAFNGFSTLEEVSFPSGIEFIGNGAFFGCPNIKSVTLPANTEIGDNAFHYSTEINRWA